MKINLYPAVVAGACLPEAVEGLSLLGGEEQFADSFRSPLDF